MMRRAIISALLGVFIASTAAAQQPARRPPGADATRPRGTSAIRGRVIAADTGNPIRHAQVLINLPNQNGTPLQQVTATDTNGAYEFLALQAGRYGVSASHGGYVTLQFGQRQPFETGASLEIADGQIASDINFALPRGGVIAGRITDAGGIPIAGTYITVERYVYGPTGRRRVRASGIGTSPMTDDLGEFRAYGLMPGSYIVSAAPQRFFTASITERSRPDDDAQVQTYFPGTASAGEAQPVVVNIGEDTQMSFAMIATRMARVSGVVRTSDGKAPPRCYVILRLNQDSMYSVNLPGSATEADGTFSFSSVPPGEYMLIVAPAPGQSGTFMEFASMPLTVSGRDIADFNVTTTEGGMLAGRVNFEGGVPRSSATPLRVTPFPLDPSTAMTGLGVAPGVVDATGQFQLKGVAGRMLLTLPSPWVIVSVTANGRDLTDIPFDARPGMSIAGIEITATQRQTIVRGSVKDTSGMPVKEYSVAIVPTQLREGAVPYRFIRTVRPDQNGTFVVRALPAGEYTAVALDSIEQGAEWDPAFQQRARQIGKPFKLALGQELTIDLTLVP